MTKTTDKQLDGWLDTYKVDTSSLRLERLEERIMLNLPLAQSTLFAPMNWREKALAGFGICSILLLVLLGSQMIHQPEAPAYLTASAYQYSGY